MTTRELCPTCDRPVATSGDYGYARDRSQDLDPALCWGLVLPATVGCGHPPVDWRQRCLAAEAQLAAYRAPKRTERAGDGAPQATPDKDKETDR